MNDNVINLFKEKVSAIPKGESPEATVKRFHDKLDEVLCEFQTFSVAEKYELMESVCTMNKNIFELYMNLKKRYECVV